MNPADLRALLRDALKLWDIQAQVTVEPGHIALTRPEGQYRISKGPPPTRWFLQTPDREAANRPPRPAPSITARIISALLVANDKPKYTPRA